MLKISLASWIAKGAACLDGSYRRVSRQPNLASCSRQTAYDHDGKVQADVEARHQGGPTRAELVTQNYQPPPRE
jgi:hypothetical protein